MVNIKPKKEKLSQKKNTKQKVKRTARRAIKVKATKRIKPSTAVGLKEHKKRLKQQIVKIKRGPSLVKKETLRSKIKTPVAVKELKRAKQEIPQIEKEIIQPTLMAPIKLEEPRVTKAEIPVEEIVEEIREIKPEIPLVKEKAPQAKIIPAELKELELELPITLKDLSVRLQAKPSILIKMLMDRGIMAGINQVLSEEVVTKLCAQFGFKLRRAPDEEELALRIHLKKDKPDLLQPRPSIVTLMGHVDHGKTSLLDAIRKTKLAESEHGGITQHIGAYRVILPEGEITFLDTPGHEAFTAMRARGASITDIVVLVIAADEAIMPQTQEAIDHAREAKVPMLVTINKIDKPQADIEKVKKQLSGLNLTAEDWGGKTITVPVSAKTGQGIDTLLEMILLEAQMLELKANPKRPAQGVVIESKMVKGKGPVSTLLIQNGTLHLNDNLLVGICYGKVRAMFDEHGKSITLAPPSFPIEVLGISGLPQPGEQFFVLEDEKTVRELALMRQEKARYEERAKTAKRISLEDLHAQIQEGKLKELKLIIKTDVQGSLEAIKDTLNKLNVSEIRLNIIHEAVGNINASDVILAVASNALILGFNVTCDERAKALVQKEAVEARIYNIIYELANDIKQAIEGMLEPRLKKVFLGKVEIRKVFKVSRAGTVAGCFVVKGKIIRTAIASVLRDNQPVFEGKISSLKRFKDDVREVEEGFECGLALGGFEDLREGDIIEVYDIEKIARKLA